MPSLIHTHTQTRGGGSRSSDSGPGRARTDGGRHWTVQWGHDRVGRIGLARDDLINDLKVTLRKQVKDTGRKRVRQTCQ